MIIQQELQSKPVRVLGLFDSTSIIVGVIVGTGIFMTPMSIAQLVPSIPMILLAWTLAGLICLAGGLCYAELAATYPGAGGDYVYLSRSFGGWAGFLFSWSKMLVIRTGSIAAVAFTFGTYAGRVYPLGTHTVGLYASLAIGLLTALNIADVRAGAVGQNVLTIAKICGIVSVLVVAVVYSGSPPSAGSVPATVSLPNFMVAMVLILWTYGGWNEAAYIAAEVRRPERNLPRSILYGTLGVLLLYVCINAAFLWTLGVEGVGSSGAVAADCLGKVFGDAGQRFISVLILVSALGAVNGLILTGARISYAMGAETTLFKLLGRWSVKRKGPVWALSVQGFISISLVWSGGFETLVEYTAAAAWLFFALVPLSLIILRSRNRETRRKYEAPLYPFIPIVFCIVSLYMLYSSVNYAGRGALYGFLIVLSGLPVYWISRRMDQEAPTS